MKTISLWLKHTSIRVLLSIFIIYFINPVIYSQSENEQLCGITINHVNSLQPGKWGIQFEIGSYVNPNYFEAVMFAVKPVLSRHIALKTGVSYDFSSRDGEDRVMQQSSPTESKSENATVIANIQYNFNPKDRVVFYSGLGMIYKYYRNKYDYFFAYNNSNGEIFSDKYYSSEKKWSAGAIGMVGIEWFIIPRISLIAEYDITLTFGKYESVDTEIDNSIYQTEIKVETEYSNVGEFRFNIAKLGISAYF